MRKEISPVVAVIVVLVVVVVAAAMYWRGTQKTVQLPPKPPSGPIVLPPSQQGRRMPAFGVSGPMPTRPQPGQTSK